MPAATGAVPIHCPGAVWSNSTWVHACVFGPPAGRNMTTPRVVSADGLVTRNVAVPPLTDPDTVAIDGGSKSVLFDQFTVQLRVGDVALIARTGAGPVGRELSGDEHELLRLAARLDGRDDLLQPRRKAATVTSGSLTAGPSAGLTAAYTGLKLGVS